MQDLVKDAGVGMAEDVRWKWGIDDGIFRLARLKGPYGDVAA